jgi:hypothetical protein
MITTEAAPPQTAVTAKEGEPISCVLRVLCICTDRHVFGDGSDSSSSGKDEKRSRKRKIVDKVGRQLGYLVCCSAAFD